MKKIIYIFFLSFTLNILWENFHSFLYLNYKGTEISQFILIRASFFDAFLITLISLPFLYYSFFKKRNWIIFIFGIIIAILNEWYGLKTGRWEYKDIMPIIPIIKTGITPTFQLGIIAYFSINLQKYIPLNLKKIFNLLKQ